MLLVPDPTHLRQTRRGQDGRVTQAVVMIFQIGGNLFFTCRFRAHGLAPTATIGNSLLRVALPPAPTLMCHSATRSRLQQTASTRAPPGPRRFASPIYVYSYACREVSSDSRHMSIERPRGRTVAAERSPGPFTSQSHWTQMCLDADAAFHANGFVVIPTIPTQEAEPITTPLLSITSHVSTLRRRQNRIQQRRPSSCQRSKVLGA